MMFQETKTAVIGIVDEVAVLLRRDGEGQGKLLNVEIAKREVSHSCGMRSWKAVLEVADCLENFFPEI